MSCLMINIQRKVYENKNIQAYTPKSGESAWTFFTYEITSENIADFFQITHFALQVQTM